MTYEAAMTDAVDRQAREHLLRHYRNGQTQEDLCFALWYPSHGATRLTAIVSQLVLPTEGETHLHGNASFEGRYVTRAIKEAIRHNAGLAMLHSHPAPGWQDVSPQDIDAEREVAYPAQATSIPLLGMTIGTDGYWSGRLWHKDDNQVVGTWCRKVRVPALSRYAIYWEPHALRASGNSDMKRRTIETWGIGTQRNIENLRIGVVGVGSVGALVAEALARLGVADITLIDPDIIETHNLDRLLYANRASVGRSKVSLAQAKVRRHTTASHLQVCALPSGIQYQHSYRAALDCDLIVSCVDRPVARDVLNYVAIAHLIPIIEGGVAVDADPKKGDFSSARWRSHLVIPGSACIRCTGQYTSSDVLQELDGSLDDPSYIANLPPDSRPANQNVFPFSLGSASMQVNLMIRYLLGKDWWPTVTRQEYRYIAARSYNTTLECHPHCSFRGRIALGDRAAPSYLREPPPRERRSFRERLLIACRKSWNALPWVRSTDPFAGVAPRRIVR